MIRCRTPLHAAIWIVMLASASPAGAAGENDRTWLSDASHDLERVLFVTRAPLLAKDDDERCFDLYLRLENDLDLISGGEATEQRCRNVGPHDASEDLTTVAFMSRSQLVAQDGDDNRDIYAWSDGKVQLLVPESPRSMKGRGLSADGSAVFFSTQDPLVVEDTDRGLDIYRSQEGHLDLITVGETSRQDARQYPIVNESGSVAYFSTLSPLLEADLDAGCGGWRCAGDIYRWEAGSLTLVSTGPTDPGTAGVGYVHASASGSRAYFATTDGLTPDDQNGVGDVYEWTSDSIRRITPDPIEAGPETWYGIWPSKQGSKVVVETNAVLLPDDLDGATDAYLIDGNDVELISATHREPAGEHADVEFVAPNGRTIFTSGAPLVASDRNEFEDIYAWDPSDGNVVLVSGGREKDYGYNDYEGADPLGARVVFDTNHSLLPEDEDDGSDVYVATSDGFEILTGNLALEPFRDAYAEAVHRDARSLIVRQYEALSPEDTDGFQPDLYLLAPGREPKLLSAAP